MYTVCIWTHWHVSFQVRPLRSLIYSNLNWFYIEYVLNAMTSMEFHKHNFLYFCRLFFLIKHFKTDVVTISSQAQPKSPSGCLYHCVISLTLSVLFSFFLLVSNNKLSKVWFEKLKMYMKYKGSHLHTPPRQTFETLSLTATQHCVVSYLKETWANLECWQSTRFYLSLKITLICP